MCRRVSDGQAPCVAECGCVGSLLPHGRQKPRGVPGLRERQRPHGEPAVPREQAREVSRGTRQRGLRGARNG